MTTASPADRQPTLGPAGAAMLRRLAEHPAAPRFTARSGSRLRADEVAALRTFERRVLAADLARQPGALPDWLPDFVAKTLASVPLHRARGLGAVAFLDIPPISRADLARDIARCVPDDVATGRLIAYTTTGTTGHPLTVPSHPLVAGRYLAFHKRALARFGIVPRAGAGEVGVILLGFQRGCFTYVSVTPGMGESGLAKINLDPADWRDPADRVRYIDALAPEILAGDPLSFAELLRLPLRHRPRALISVSMALSDGLRQALQQRFGCPVADIYSMNEAGPIAVFDPQLGGHLALQERLHIELLDAAGRPVRPGERGEVTLTGGFNFCLPLLRYRTGDHARLVETAHGPLLVDLVGRQPVRFRHVDGSWRNNVDVSRRLAALPLAQFTLRQQVDGSLVLALRDAAPDQRQAARAALQALLGPWPLRVEAIPAGGDKRPQYASEWPEAMP